MFLPSVSEAECLVAEIFIRQATLVCNIKTVEHDRSDNEQMSDHKEKTNKSQNSSIIEKYLYKHEKKQIYDDRV